MRKSMSTLVMQPSFRALGQMQVKWQTFEEEKREKKKKKTRERDKCMVVSPPMPDYHTSVSYFLLFQMSAISPGFGPGL